MMTLVLAKLNDGTILFGNNCTSSEYLASRGLTTEYDKWVDCEWTTCSCGKDESAQLFQTIRNDIDSDGFYWNGRVCRYCKCITSSITIGEVDYKIGKLDWVINWAESADKAVL